MITVPNPLICLHDPSPRLGFSLPSGGYGPYRGYIQEYVNLTGLGDYSQFGAGWVERTVVVASERGEVIEDDEAFRDWLEGREVFEDYLSTVGSFVYTVLSDVEEIKRQMLEEGSTGVKGVEGFWVKNKLPVLEVGNLGKIQSLKPLITALKTSGGGFSRTIEKVLENGGKWGGDYKAETRIFPPVMESEVLVWTIAGIISRQGRARHRGGGAVKGLGKEANRWIVKCFHARVLQVMCGWLFNCTRDGELFSLGVTYKSIPETLVILKKMRSSWLGKNFSTPAVEGDPFKQTCAKLLHDFLEHAKKPKGSGWLYNETLKSTTGQEISVGDVEEAFKRASELGLKFLCDVAVYLQVGWNGWRAERGEPPDDDYVRRGKASGELFMHTHSSLVLEVGRWMGLKIEGGWEKELLKKYIKDMEKDCGTVSGRGAKRSDDRRGLELRVGVEEGRKDNYGLTFFSSLFLSNLQDEVLNFYDVPVYSWCGGSEEYRVLCRVGEESVAFDSEKETETGGKGLPIPGSGNRGRGGSGNSTLSQSPGSTAYINNRYDVPPTLVCKAEKSVPLLGFHGYNKVS